MDDACRQHWRKVKAVKRPRPPQAVESDVVGHRGCLRRRVRAQPETFLWAGNSNFWHPFAPFPPSYSFVFPLMGCILFYVASHPFVGSAFVKKCFLREPKKWDDVLCNELVILNRCREVILSLYRLKILESQRIIITAACMKKCSLGGRSKFSMVKVREEEALIQWKFGRRFR